MRTLSTLGIIGMAAVIFCIGSYQNIAHGFACHVLQPGLGIQPGFGAPYDVVFGTGNQLMPVDCNLNTATITLGDNNPNRYIYELGYEYINGQWVPFTLTGVGKQGQWIPSTATVQVSAVGDGNPRYFVGYICNWNGNQWKCGCRNQFCNQSFWQLQGYTTVTQSSGGSSTSGGGSSSGGGAGATCGGGQCGPCQACGGDCNQCGGNRTIWVDGQNGNDGNNGLSQGQAFRTIGKGASTVRGGDVMIVRPGKYYEKPTFSNLGSSQNNPVWILSEVPGQAVISGLWREADQGNVNWRSDGNGVYSASHGDVYSGSYDDVYLFRYKSKGDLEAGSVQGVRKPTYGIAPSGGRVYIRLPNNENPNGKSVQLTDRFAQNVVSIQNSPYVIFDGFWVEGAGDTQAMSVDDGSHHLTIRNSIFSHNRHVAHAPDNILFEWNEYYYPNFYSFADYVIRNNGSGRQALYDLVKVYFSNNGNSYLEGGVLTNTGSYSSWSQGGKASNNSELRYNYNHQNFDGERFGSFKDSSTHHNVYNYNYDDPIEFEGLNSNQGRNLRAHDNLIMNPGAVMMSHQDILHVLRGPQYVYRNVMTCTDDVHCKPWTVLKSFDLTALSDKIYYYHNYINVGRAQMWHQYADQFALYNNIILFDQVNITSGTPDSKNNLFVNNRDFSQITGSNGTYLGSNKSAAGVTSDFTLQSNSPAVDAGTTLPGNLPDSHQVNGTPDIGPFELGENLGNDWPRPARRAFSPTKPDRWK